MKIIDYSQTEVPSPIPSNVIDQVRKKEAMIMFPMSGISICSICPICSNTLTPRYHEFRSYKVCKECSPNA